MAKVKIPVWGRQPTPGLLRASSITLQLEWVGPTRELISASATIEIRKSNIIVELSIPASASFPLLEFGINVNVHESASTEEDSMMKLSGPATSYPVSVSVVRLGKEACKQRFGSTGACDQSSRTYRSFPLAGPILGTQPICNITANGSGTQLSIPATRIPATPYAVLSCSSSCRCTFQNYTSIPYAIAILSTANHSN